METNRQKKIATIIQEDMADILMRDLKAQNLQGVVLSVTDVHVTADLSAAKIYVSVFPKVHQKGLIAEIAEATVKYRHELARRTRHQLRRVPELTFQADDSVERAQEIEKSLTNPDNPISNPDLLDKRKKI
ncbi:MAG: 30S ribosome-binding factor RbfA [Flavobacteriaceae bacterium]|nr:30S ribosome-binding factor RbfA [Bacteroidota bacterium]MDT8415604.1 30S ribosome-binding factor RbfA [Flavobacteriaceae bacterium]